MVCIGITVQGNNVYWKIDLARIHAISECHIFPAEILFKHNSKSKWYESGKHFYILFTERKDSDVMQIT